MSRPSQQQPKQHADPWDYTGERVIQNHAIHAAGAPPPGATDVVETAAPSAFRPTLIGSLQQVPQLVPVNPPPLANGGEEVEEGGGEMKKPHAEKDSDEYRQRRERNNLAVKKSRMRSKQKAQDTQARVNELKEENERLEAKIKLLSKELSVLKDLFLEHAHNLAEHAPQPPGDPPSNNNNNSNGQ